MQPVLSIVIPTITGREHWLEETLAAFGNTTRVTYEVIIERDHEVCGTAWNAGIARAQGEYVLIAADDLTPHPGWFEAGWQVVDAGGLPSALIFNPDGTVQSCGDKIYRVADRTVTNIARIPLASKEQMEFIAPILEIHYATDNWFSHRGRLHGWESIICTEMRFTHHFAQEGRIDGRVLDDVEVFRKAAGLESATPAAL